MKFTPQLQAEYDSLDTAIKDAVQRRRDWVVAHLDELSEFRVGDKIYANMMADERGIRLAGVVTRVYVENDKYDGRPKIFYGFDQAPGFSYSGNTEGSYAFWYTHAHWVLLKRCEIDQLQREIA